MGKEGRTREVGAGEEEGAGSGKEKGRRWSRPGSMGFDGGVRAW